MKITKYRMMKRFLGFDKDQIVFECMGPDYGLCSDALRRSGIKHVFLTDSSDGLYPGTAVPITHVAKYVPAQGKYVSTQPEAEYNSTVPTKAPIMPAMKNLPKIAVCLLVMNSLGQLLTVTRRNSTELSLPGGKVDPDESALSAAIRETAEETGIDITQFVEEDSDATLVPIFSEVVKGADGKDFYCITYLYTGTIDVNVGESWVVEQGITVSWQTVTALLTGAFSDYNTRALDSLNIILERNAHAIAY